MCEHKSVSHLIFMINIERSDFKGTRVGKLILADLAGCEWQTNTSVTVSIYLLVIYNFN